MGFTTINTDAIAFKKVLGKSHTQETFSPNEEGFNTNVQVSLSSMFYSEIEPLPVTNSGLTTLYSTNGIIERIKFPVEIIPDTYIGTNRSQGYKLKLPSDYDTFGYLYPTYNAGTYLHSSIGKLQIVPSNFGQLKTDGSTEYDPILYQTDGSTVIGKNDPIDWFLDTYSGILFVQDPPVGYDIGATRPGFVEAYLYVAKFASEVLSGVTAGANVGNGTAIFKNRTDATLNFKTLHAGENLSIVSSTNDVYINFSGITGASNGLTKQGKIIGLGGTLTGSTTIGLSSSDLIFNASTGTLKYGSDLSSNYNVRSLPDVGYVSGLTSAKLDTSAFNGYTGTTAPASYVAIPLFNVYTGATNSRLLQVETNYVTGATNGLTKKGKIVRLGGILTGDTYISGSSFGIELGTNVSKLYSLAGYASTNIVFETSGEANRLSSLTNSSQPYWEQTAPDGSYKRMSFSGLPENAGSAFIIETFRNTGGGFSSIILRPNNNDILITGTGTAKYNANYSSNFTSRSLVDKGYVTGITSTLVSSSSVISGATNGLSVTGKKIKFGGNLTGATTIGLGANILTFTGSTGHLQYGSDLSSNFTSRSIVDKGYVTGITSTKLDTSVFSTYSGTTNGRLNQIETNYVTGATNGLTKQGKIVRLGGTLTDDTTIGLGANILTFTGTTGTLNYGSDLSSNFTSRSLVDKGYVTGITSTLASSSNAITGATNGLTKKGKNVTLGGTLTGATTIGLGSNILTFTGTTGTLKYGSDLSSNFTSRSLVDKGYVTGITSTLASSSNAITGATNGLTKQGKIARLGGNLTGATTIGLASNNLTFTASTATLRYGSDLSSNYVARSIPDVAYVTGLTVTKINEVTVRNTTLTSYTADTTSNFIGCSGVTHVYLPTTPKLGQQIIVTDIKGVAYTLPITIHGNSKLIEVDTDILIDSDYGSITLIYNGIMWSITAYAA